MRRRSILMSPAILSIPSAQAQGPASWPTHPVTVVVPYAPGGASDIVGRQLANALQPIIGQSVVVENRTGGSGAVAAQYAARAAPDGHTLLIAANGILTINPHLLPNLPYDPLKDFAPVTLAVSGPNMLIVRPDFPATTLPAVIDWLRAHPGTLSYGSGGIGSSEHLCMELLLQRTGTTAIHVPYSGTSQALTDVLAGVIDAGFLNTGAVTPHVRAGRVTAIAIGSAARSPKLPDVPAVAETLPGYLGTSWHGVVTAHGTPEPLLDRIHAAVLSALNTPEATSRFDAIGFSVSTNSRAEFATLIRDDLERWGGVIRNAQRPG